MSSYYDILEVNQTASLTEIKKAYRRLALAYHPDRNNGSEESTEKFQQIGEAYEILSDEQKRKEYDRSISSNRFDFGQNRSSKWDEVRRNQTTTNQSTDFHPHSYYRSRFRRNHDPFAQFNNLFRDDDFFKQAFEDMDDLFAKKFQSQSASTATSNPNEQNEKAVGELKRRDGENWFAWTLRKCGVQVTVNTSTRSGNGTVTATSYSSSQSTYSNKTKKTFIDGQGRRVIMQSMEKDGNRIEEKYVGRELVERKVNGVIEENVSRTVQPRP